MKLRLASRHRIKGECFLYSQNLLLLLCYNAWDRGPRRLSLSHFFSFEPKELVNECMRLQINWHFLFSIFFIFHYDISHLILYCFTLLLITENFGLETTTTLWTLTITWMRRVVFCYIWLIVCKIDGEIIAICYYFSAFWISLVYRKKHLKEAYYYTHCFFFFFPL